jgi:hypothetical protein
VCSDAPTQRHPFEAYGLHFAIEENVLDDTSSGFHLASALVRSALALNRLCLVLAITTLSRVTGHRRGAARQAPSRRPPIGCETSAP